MSQTRGAPRSHKIKRTEAAPSSTAARAAQRFRYIVAALAVILLLGIFSSEITENDLWWNLASGRYIVEHRALPAPDPFAYTTAIVSSAHPEEARLQRFNLTHEWLAQVLFYAEYAIGGFATVVFVRSLLLTIFCALAGLVAFQLSGKFYGGVAAAFGTAWLTVNFSGDRPAVATFVCVAVFISALELRRGVWALPVVALVWSNCHGGFFLAWLILLAFCAESVPLGRLRVPISAYTARERRKLWLVAACCIVACGINPNGFGVISTLVGYRQSEMISNLIEWHAPDLWGPPYAFDILLYASAVTVLLSWRNVRLRHWILFVAFAAAALQAFRNVLLIGFLSPILIAAYFPFRVRLPRSVVWAAPAVLLAAIAVGVARGSFFQWRIASWQLPAGAADYLTNNHVMGRMFNTWEQGGYLMWRLWPQQRVFIDGRALSPSLDRDYRQILYNLGSDVMRLAGPRADLLNRYGVEVVVMNMFEYVTGAEYPLPLALATAPAESGWRLVYDDPRAVVFWRNPPAGTPVFNDPYARVVTHADTECSEHIQHDPSTPACALALAKNWAAGGGVEQALRMLRLYFMSSSSPEADAVDLWHRLGGGPLPRR